MLVAMRESASLGNQKEAGELLGVSGNTLGSYERGEVLPDVDFLAVFAAKTGADFQELLRLRLASGKTEEARRLSEQLRAEDEAHRAAPTGASRVLDEVEAFLNQRQDFPLVVTGFPADSAIVSSYQSLKSVVRSLESTQIERARADMLLDLAFADEEAQRRRDRVHVDMKARVQAINRDFEDVSEAAGWKPPLLVRQAITGAMLFHGLTKEGALYQLQVLAAQAHLDAEQQNTR